MSTATFYIGDVMDVLRTMPDGSVDLCLSSPPFLSLRSYLPSDHPDKGKEIGGEPNPAAFIDTLLAVTAEVRRVLAPHGTIAWELGDTYSGSGGAGGDYAEDGLREGQAKFRQKKADGWPLAKSLCLIPELYRVALVYGRNVLHSPLTASEMLDVIEQWHSVYPSGTVDVLLDYLRTWLAAGERFGRGPVIEYEPWRARNVVRWCLDVDTPVYVRTPTGDRPMRLLHLHQQFQPGRFKLWDGERWTPVLGTSSSHADDALEIEFRNGERISCTREHQWPVERGLFSGNVTAEELRVGDIIPTVQLPAPDEPKAPAHLPDDDIGWFVGMYLAEGSLDTKGRIQFAGNVSETARAERLHRISAAYDGTASTYNHEGNTQNVVVRCDALAAVLARYLGGTHARNKHLSPHAWNRSDGFLSALLDGYLEGDGHYDAKNDRWRLGFTDNPWLARDIRTICARLGADCRIRRVRRPGPDPRGGTWTGTQPFYFRGSIRFHPGPKVLPPNQIVAIRESRRSSFIDVGVEGEPHLFALASGILTHNCRPNPPVGALGDKFRPATSDMVIACTSPKRWFDLDAVRTVHASGDHHLKYPQTKYVNSGKQGEHARKVSGSPLNPVGAPPLDWWEIPPGGYQGSHYAVFPPELCVKPIKAMCPAEVCRTCGEPRRRIVAKSAEYEAFRAKQNERYANKDNSRLKAKNASGSPGGWDNVSQGSAGSINEATYETLGWTDCGHGDFRPGRVLDPFGGSGTTGLVATGHGREAWLIDLDERNADLARERLGMFVDVVDTRERGAA